MKEHMQVFSVSDPTMVMSMVMQDDSWRTLHLDFDNPVELVIRLCDGEWDLYFVTYDEFPICLFGTRAMSLHCYEVMWCFPKAIRGKVAFEACRRMLDAIFEDGEVRKVVGFIPTDNPLSVRMAGLFGGKREGLIKDAGVRKGESYDLVVMSYSKETYNVR